jgi:signal transduction histidine kinase/CheY-like chemotaxis protein
LKKLLFLLFFYSISFYAQNKDYEHKTTFHLDMVFDANDRDLALIHAKQALHYADLSQNDTLLMKAYHALSHAYKKFQNYKQTKENSYKCLELAKKIDDKYFLFLSNNLLGIVKAGEKQYQLSTEFYSNALILTKERNDTINESLLYHNIALNYYLIDNFELAKVFILKSEETYKSIKVFDEPYREWFDFIFLYIKKAIIIEDKNEALEYVNKTIEIAKKSDYINFLPLTYKYKGRVYMKHNDFDLAFQSFKKTLTFEGKQKSSDTYLETINALVQLKHYNIAKKYVDTLLLNFNTADIKSIFLDKNKVFAEVYQNTGDFDKALFYANKRAIHSDSLLKYNNYELFAQYGKKFETKEKEKEIVKQQLVIEEQDGERKNMILFGSLALFVGMLLFQWRFNTQKNSKKQAEDAYEKEKDFNQMRTAFLENISHEIRTPLTLINGYLDLINEEVESPKLKKYINNALINSKKVIFDADEILNLLKFEDHKLSLKMVSKPLDEFLKTILLSFEVLANTRNIELVYESAINKKLSVKIDARKVEKILTNLISNAIKFSDSNSKVIFKASINNNNNLEVKVTDFGQGIDKEDQKRIFTRFYQSKNNKSIGGIGIGLLLAKDFAQFLGGNVTVESKIGKGSVFTFTMPITKFDTKALIVEQENHVEVEEKVNGVKNKPSILIVEDNIEMSNYLKEILSPFYNCTFAFDGLEGLTFVKNRIFDLVASDIMMPKLDGYQFREQLKLIPQYEKIPFILITAKSLPEDKTKGFSIGIDDYITKPFQKEELIVRIDNLLMNSTNLKLCFVDSEKSPEGILETHTDKLVNEIKEIILKNLSKEDFKVEDLALQINYSQRQLSRILNKETGLSTVRFILEIKLTQAYKMIENKTHKTISEIQYEVGISSPSYFSEKFKNRFGINPSELMQKSNT